MHIFKDKEFAKKLVRLMIPVLLQELITTLIASLSGLLIGAAGADQTTVVGVGYALNIFLVYRYAILAIAVAGGLFIAQYYGRGDLHDVKRVYHTLLRIAVSVSLIFFLLSLSISKQLIGLFNPDSDIIEVGAQFLRILSVSFLFFDLSYINTYMLKNLHLANFATISSLAALVADVLLTCLLLFVFKLGANSAAWAIVVTRFVEFAFSAVFLHLKSTVYFDFKLFFNPDIENFLIVIRHMIPIVLARVAYAIGTLIFSAIVGHMGDKDLSTATTILNYFVPYLHAVSSSVGVAAGILIGRELGANRFELAKEHSRDIVKISIFTGIVNILILMLCLPIALLIFSKGAVTTDVARIYLLVVFSVCATQLIQQAINTVFMQGFFTPGGRSAWYFIVQMIPQWCITIPLAVAGSYLIWPAIVIVVLMYAEETIRAVMNIAKFLRKDWLRNVIKKDPIIVEKK
ncbi:MAG: MATE family efflux transporter [Bacilli bacterium]|nr:MATE family efflux transporter [Bacilli bacterium]